ncbi:dihydropteroate synthase [Wenzhouxiangella marina]|nr:dihydropteroate synthase [Wenzhouxiangella marina]MBB6086118.1 dihydropteroate synthase [Wenzhouxiangella marina]
MHDDRATRLKERIHRAHEQGPALVMGIVNVTPDSFSDGGRFEQAEQAVEHGLRLAAEGADILDIGGESTRPGAQPVGIEEELARVIPVIERLSRQCDVPISIDTSKPEVMRAAVSAGAAMINDVNGLRAPGAVATAAELAVPVCLMHMQGEPRTMQARPSYQDVVSDVRDFLLERAEVCQRAGLDRANLVLDPGFGFGKTLEHNLALLNALDELARIGFPVLAGLSRKSMLGRITGRERPDQRLAASLAVALIAAQKGAAILRVHDVAETVDVVKVWNATREVSSR